MEPILLDFPNSFETERLTIRAPRSGDGPEIDAPVSAFAFGGRRTASAAYMDASSDTFAALNALCHRAAPSLIACCAELRPEAQASEKREVKTRSDTSSLRVIRTSLIFRVAS